MFNFIKNKITGSRSLRVSKNVSVSLDEFMAIGERDAVLASSGMGKSYLTGVIAEETLENGGLLCVIDPEGEYFTLAERYPLLIIGGEHQMLPLSADAIDLYIEAMLQTNLSLVFDLSELLDHEQQTMYAQIAESLFHQETVCRRKVRLIVEEAQIYAPQRMASAGAGGKKKPQFDPVNASQKIAKRGRKRAIDSLWATQRPASLSKDILSQCNRFWFGGIQAEQDYKAIKPYLNEAGISFADVKSLRPGEFFLYSRGKTQLLKVRPRHCKHGGATPDGQQQFSAVTNMSLDRAIEALAEQIRQRGNEKERELTEVEQLKERIHCLEDENAKLKDDLNQEKMATKVIKRIEVRNEEGELIKSTTTRRQRRVSIDKDSFTMPGEEVAAIKDDGATAQAASEVTVIAPDGTKPSPTVSKDDIDQAIQALMLTDGAQAVRPAKTTIKRRTTAKASAANPLLMEESY